MLKLQYFGHLMRRADSLGKTDVGKDQGQKKKRAAEDETVGQHHQLNGHEFGQTLEDSGGRGSLVRCSPWGHKESDMTWRLDNIVLEIRNTKTKTMPGRCSLRRH